PAASSQTAAAHFSVRCIPAPSFLRDRYARQTAPCAATCNPFHDPSAHRAGQCAGTGAIPPAALPIGAPLFYSAPKAAKAPFAMSRNQQVL
ncbi:MAG: hypothetical protein CML61_11785, partial [Rhodobacteraceae bacterium]|nr:hypothetical protein [Paracoccaceae bacterium]